MWKTWFAVGVKFGNVCWAVVCNRRLRLVGDRQGRGVRSWSCVVMRNRRGRRCPTACAVAEIPDKACDLALQLCESSSVKSTLYLPGLAEHWNWGFRGGSRTGNAECQSC